ncbi:MAG: putative transposase [Verrucomicrobiales bacterium]|jgi:putative transposase
MSRRRIILPDFRSSSYYHCLSRVVDRRFVFEAHERDVFRKIMRQVEAFSGVRVLTWTILSNHFHVLLEVPPRPVVELTDDEILDRCRSLYSPDAMVAVEWEFAEAQRLGAGALEKLRARFLRRMFDLSEFMKTLKQKFTSWFNRKNDRVGVLWEARFKSVIVEGHWNSLLKVAAYIDLNSVRAGMVADPIDYRWCGYSEAVAGDRAARRGISATLFDLKQNAHWGDAAPRYRKIMFGIGAENSERAGLSRAAIEKVWTAGGSLSLAQLLRCRVRYFSDGLAVGRESFIESIFAVLREVFTEERKTASRRMAGGGWDDFKAARALKVKPIDPASTSIQAQAQTLCVPAVDPTIKPH